MIRVRLLIFVCFMHMSTINTQVCDSFENTNVSASVNTDSSFYVVNGCFEPEQFDGKDIDKMKVHSEITRLGKDSIRNLLNLESIDIQRNSLEILEPQAFRNVPNLKFVSMMGNNLKEIPKDVFNSVPTIKNLILANNQIDFIASGAFSNMESLERIDLSSNVLTYLNREWFENCPNLNYIDFYHNKISTIPRGAFSSLPKLSAIAFGGNEITTIQPDAFRNLKYLNYLSLYRNKLTVLDERAFPNKIHIDSLYIQNNRLNYLPGNLLIKLSVGAIFLDRNPWKCPCLQRLHDWLFFTSGSVRVSSDDCRTPNDPVCVVPRGNACQESVDDELTRRYIGHMNNLTESLGKGRACVISSS